MTSASVWVIYHGLESVCYVAFVLSGNRNGGSTNNQGSNGNYWSSVANNNNNAYNLNLNSSNVNPQNNNNKWNGFSVRCVAN